MEQIQIGQYEYTIGRLNALDQLHVSRKIAPIIPKILPILTELAKGDLVKVLEKIEHQEKQQGEHFDSKDIGQLEGFSDALSPMAEVLAQMPEEDVNYLIHKCLSVVRRGSSAVSRNNVLMFDDLDLGQIFPLLIAVIRLNLGNFIRGLLTKASTIQQSP